MAKYRLGEIAPIEQGTVDSNGICWLLNLDMVESNSGRIIDYLYVDENEIGESTISFDTSNVLYSKLRPYLNKVVLPDRCGYATSEILPLRPNTSIITRAYLMYFLRSPHFVAYISEKTSGAKMPRVNTYDLIAVEIECPSLVEQNRITAIMDYIVNIIYLRQQELQKLDELVKARFVEIFGDPVYNSKGLSTKKLSALGSLDRGRSKHRPRNDPQLLGGPYPLIQTGEVASAGLYITSYNHTYSEFGLQQSKMWSAGTLCITIAANIAQTAILAFDACFPDSVVGFVPNENVSAIYMHYWFCFFQKILEEQAPQVAQKNINLAILSELDVMLPTKKEQGAFADFVEQVDKSKLTIRQSLDKLEMLKKALMQKYFG